MSEAGTLTPAASSLHADALVWDNHAGFAPFLHPDLSFLERWRRAGCTYLSINVGFDIAMSWEQTLESTAHYRRWLDTHQDDFLLVDGIDDVHRAKQEGKLAVGFDLEGGNALNGNLDMIGVYYQLGVRQMLFAYNKSNGLCGGCLDGDAPLTALGRAAVTEMNRVGMVVDCSHISESASLEIATLSSQPVIYSHSNPRVLCDHPRNIADAQIRACAATGGVIGINGIGSFLGGDTCDAERIVRHIDYVVDLVGIEYVGIGLDSVLDPEDTGHTNRTWPGLLADTSTGSGDMAQPEELPRVTEELLRRGYSDDDIRKVMGGNFVRVSGEVWV